MADRRDLHGFCPSYIDHEEGHMSRECYYVVSQPPHLAIPVSHHPPSTIHGPPSHFPPDLIQNPRRLRVELSDLIQDLLRVAEDGLIVAVRVLDGEVVARGIDVADVDVPGVLRIREGLL